MLEQIISWGERLRKEPGHEFLESGFAELLRELTENALPSDESSRNFLKVSELLGREVARTVDSLQRCEGLVDRWATDSARRREDFRDAMNPFAQMEEEARAFQLTSERWGRYLRRFGELGAYQVKQDDSRPPLYRFVLELRPPWRSYANRCIAAFGELISAYRGRGLTIPHLTPDAAAGWNAARGRREFHVGRGAFIATLEPGLDESQLACALTDVGARKDV